MQTNEIKSLLKTIHIPLGVAVGIFAIVGGVYVYRNYLETVKLKLQITELRKDLGIEKPLILKR